MEDEDAETMIAYYCFVNLGWSPSKYVSLPFRERSIIGEFVTRAIKHQNELEKKSRGYGRKFSRRR